MGEDNLQQHIKNNRTAPMRTICELHRKVYKELSARKDDKYKKILHTLESTYKKGKFISEKLHEYNAKKFYHDFWDLENHD
jgi:hypothetical protein